MERMLGWTQQEWCSTHTVFPTACPRYFYWPAPFLGQEWGKFLTAKLLDMMSAHTHTPLCCVVTGVGMYCWSQYCSTGCATYCKLFVDRACSFWPPLSLCVLTISPFILPQIHSTHFHNSTLVLHTFFRALSHCFAFPLHVQCIYISVGGLFRKLRLCSLV